MRSRIILAALSALAVTTTAAGCGSSGDDAKSKTITIAYQKFGAFIQLDQQL